MSTGERARWEPPGDAVQALAADAPPGPFTRFLRAWQPGLEPEPALAAEMWSAFGRAVHAELRRRRLTQTSPQWLGIYGFRGWWEGAGRGGAFEELLADAYRYVFLERFASLKAQTVAKANVEGVVLASIRNFLHDRQRGHDRLGTRLFEVLCLAARRALAKGELRVVAGSEKVTGSTVLAPGEPGVSHTLAEPEVLAGIARRWNDELLPDLVTASRADKRRLIEELARRFAELELSGVAAFRFGDLVAPLQADVRARWAALLEPAEEEPRDEEEARGLGRLRRAFVPSGGAPDAEAQLIAADRFTKLIDCADAAIEASAASERTREYLRRVLLLFRAFGTEGSEIDGDQLPSSRSLAEHLKIPRERMRELVGTLKGFLRRCRDQLDGELVRLRASARQAPEVRP